MRGAPATDLAARLRSVFVEPAGAAPAPPVTGRRRAASAAAAVLGPARSATPVAAALALRLARRAGAACAVVAGPGPAGPALRAPARPAASRAAAALRARELSAVASGSLVFVTLDAEHAPTAFVRVAAAVDGPAVLLVTRARTDALDALLARQDVLVLALGGDADPALVELERESLAALGPRVTVCRAAAPGAIRALAVAGLAAAGPLLSATDPALGVVR